MRKDVKSGAIEATAQDEDFRTMQVARVRGAAAGCAQRVR
jgi:hypothetical protein